jgi:hypothetical protein
MRVRLLQLGERTMSDLQIEQATIATLLARLHSLSISTNAEDQMEAWVIQRELDIRMECGQ